MTRGMFVVFDGIDGSGKTTQAKIFADRLEEIGVSVCRTKEPGGTPEGIEIRRRVLAGGLDPLEELDLFMEDRRIHMYDVVEPALLRGEWVACDRFSSATLAYQSFGRGLPMSEVFTRDSEVRAGRAPDISFIFDMPVHVAADRMRMRGGKLSAFDAESEAFHKRVRVGFQEMTRRTSAHTDAGFLFRHMYRINARRPPEKIAKVVWKILTQYVPVVG